MAIDIQKQASFATTVVFCTSVTVLSFTFLFELESLLNKYNDDDNGIHIAQYVLGQADEVFSENFTLPNETGERSSVTQQPLQENSTVAIQISNVTQQKNQEQNATSSSPMSNLTQSTLSIRQQVPSSSSAFPLSSTSGSALTQEKTNTPTYVTPPPSNNPMQLGQQNTSGNIPTNQRPNMTQPQSVQQQQILPPPGTVRPPASPISALPPPSTTLPPSTIYPPGITTQQQQPNVNPYNPYNPYTPYNPYNPGSTFFPAQAPLSSTLPPPYTTYPPSVFPPTTSFATSTAVAPVTGPLSPWFPSVPAISCGGTFTMTVVGAMDTNNDENDNDDKNNNDRDNNDDNNKNNDRKLYAFQIQSNGGSALDAESIEGEVFAGENNIERNNGRDFDIKDVFNDCQVVTFSD